MEIESLPEIIGNIEIEILSLFSRINELYRTIPLMPDNPGADYVMNSFKKLSEDVERIKFNQESLALLISLLQKRIVTLEKGEPPKPAVCTVMVNGVEWKD